MAKVLIIGLDAADPSLVQRWANDGTLPAMRGLMHTTMWGAVENPHGVAAGSAWPTFATGLLPGRHGQFDGTKRFDPATYRTRRLTPTELKDTFWKRLSDAGRKVAVIDVPYMLTEPSLNGVQLVDWLSHSRAGPGAMQTVPAELKDSVINRFGDDPFGRASICPTDAAPLRDIDEVTDFCAKLTQRIQAKLSLSLELLRDDDIELLLTTFHEAHDVGHMCWHVHDPDHPRHDDGIASGVGDPIKQIYQRLDATVADLLDAAGPETTVLVYCSHGMGANYTGTYLLGRMLRELDKAWRRHDEVTIVERLRHAWRGLPDSWRAVMLPARGRRTRLHRVRESILNSDRANRSCFELWVNDNTGGIRINLIGREKHGIVEPGQDYEELCAFLTDELHRVVNAKTGEPIVKEVVRPTWLYAGDQITHAPDLLVEWHREAPIQLVCSPTFGELQAPPRGTRTGDHRPGGLFFALGPEIRAGKLNVAHSAADFAPTLLSMFGAPLPDLDGHPISGLARAVAPVAPHGLSAAQ